MTIPRRWMRFNRGLIQRSARRGGSREPGYTLIGLLEQNFQTRGFIVEVPGQSADKLLGFDHKRFNGLFYFRVPSQRRGHGMRSVIVVGMSALFHPPEQKADGADGDEQYTSGDHHVWKRSSRFARGK